MKNMTGKIIVAAFLAATALTGTAAYARTECDDPGARKMHREKVMEKAVKDLGLSPEQEQMLKDQREKHFARKKELGEETRGRMKELRSELEKPDTDRSRIYGLVSSISASREQMLKERVESVLGMKEILTPEQFKEMNQKMHEKRRSFRERPGKRHGYGGTDE